MSIDEIILLHLFSWRVVWIIKAYRYINLFVNNVGSCYAKHPKRWVDAEMSLTAAHGHRSLINRRLSAITLEIRLTLNCDHSPGDGPLRKTSVGWDTSWSVKDQNVLVVRDVLFTNIDACGHRHSLPYLRIYIQHEWNKVPNTKCQHKQLCVVKRSVRSENWKKHGVDVGINLQI